jgi:hypothetical protein
MVLGDREHSFFPRTKMIKKCALSASSSSLLMKEDFGLCSSAFLLCLTSIFSSFFNYETYQAFRIVTREVHGRA